MQRKRKEMTDFTSPISHSTSARLDRYGKKAASPCLICNAMDHWCKDCPLRPKPPPKSVPFRIQHEKIRPCGSSLNTPVAAASSSSSSSEKKHSGKNACFTCGQNGHWSKDCPFKTKGSSSRKVRKNYPRCMCKCGVPRVVRTSSTPKNPGKDFYICPKTQGEQCKNSFIWCDKAEELGLCDDKPDPADQYPICHCQAGKCRLFTVQEGEELAGCQYFACMIKEGHGCCTYFEWYTSPISNEPNKNDGGENMLPHINLLAEGLKSFPNVDVGGVELRARSIPDEVVFPATTEARNEQRTNSVESLPFGWLNLQDASNFDETVVHVSPPPPTRRKLEFDDAGPCSIPFGRPNLQNASPRKLEFVDAGPCYGRPNLQNASPSNEKLSHWGSDFFAVTPFPSLKDGFGEIVVPNSLSLPQTELDINGAVGTNDTEQASSLMQR